MPRRNVVQSIVEIKDMVHEMMGAHANMFTPLCPGQVTSDRNGAHIFDMVGCGCVSLLRVNVSKCASLPKGFL